MGLETWKEDGEMNRSNVKIRKQQKGRSGN